MATRRTGAGAVRGAARSRRCASRRADRPTRRAWRGLDLRPHSCRHEPGLLMAAFLISLLSALPDSLVAVWLKLLGDGVLQQNRVRVLAAALALGVSAAATWFLRTVSTRVQRRFRDKVTIALESHV